MRIDLRNGADASQYRQWRVWLDNEDVTNRTFMADSVEGVVGLYLRNEDGSFYKVGGPWGTVAQEFRKGHVTLIQPREGAQNVVCAD